MTAPLSKQLLEWLLSKGYNYLVAENQSQYDYYQFTPVKWDIDTYQNELFKHNSDTHIILSISDSLKTLMLLADGYLNHDVNLPEQ